MIKITRLHYRYPAAPEPALQNLSWIAEAGELVLLVGSTGTGKTTFLRSLAALIPHFYGGWFEGTVLVHGYDTRLYRPIDLAGLVAYVGQEPEAQTLLDRVRDEIAFPLKNVGLSSRAVAARVEEALDLMGIAHLRDRAVESLSGGERQRLVLATALALRPRLLFLDEPTSQLDPWSAESVLEVLRRLVDELGITIVLVEHRLDRLLGLATRFTVLRDGQVDADGTLEQVAATFPDPPILVRLSQALGWSRPARTVAEARRRLLTLSLPAPSRAQVQRGAITLALERATCQRDDHVVFRNLSIAFHQGEITVIVGRNGAGKSTLLRSCLGLERLRSGKQWVLGQPLEHLNRRMLAKKVAYVPQFPGAFFLTTSLRDDLEFACRARGVPLDECLVILERFALSHLANRHPTDLSSGERQRAALALALAGKPALLILDEPTRGLDLTQKRILVDELRARAREGATIVLATHDVDFAASVADRIVLLSTGEIVSDGPVDGVLGASFAYAPIVSRIFGPAFRELDEALAILANVSLTDRYEASEISYTEKVKLIDGIGQ